MELYIKNINGKLIETKIYFLADDGIEEKEEKYNG